MAIDLVRRLSPELEDARREIEQIARGYGLDFFETIFEVVEYDELNMLAAYGGFPVRYPHWRFGAQYEELSKSYSYGLHKIYEMVINNDPCYAYLLRNNSLTDNKLVMAHVFAHCDFFKNNAWFAHTNRKMLDEMANHATRISRYIDRYGSETVEQFIDVCLSVENLIDPYFPHCKRRREDDVRARSPLAFEDDETQATVVSRFPSKPYMEPFINPPEALERELREKRERAKEQEERRSFPEEPQRDVLLFLLEHAPLKKWQHDVLSIIRDEAYYFVPQAQTKIMNEGWATYWHSLIMTKHVLTDSEIIDYADHHSGTMQTLPNRLNPYKLGCELFRDIEERWNKGRFGPEYEQCDDLYEKQHWDKKLGLGRQKIFEVRRIHNDVTFIDAFLTPEFCEEHKLFAFAYNEQRDRYEIKSREFEEIKRRLLDGLTNQGNPCIYVVDGNYLNRGELYLRHEYQGAELRQDYARDTLVNLYRLWTRPVHIETVVDDEPTVLSYDGQGHKERRVRRSD